MNDLFRIDIDQHGVRSHSAIDDKVEWWSNDSGMMHASGVLGSWYVTTGNADIRFEG